MTGREFPALRDYATSTMRFDGFPVGADFIRSLYSQDALARAVRKLLNDPTMSASARAKLIALLLTC